MAAPRGNQFWKLRSKHGRDKLFATPELLWEAACEYFDWCDKHKWKRATATKGGIVNLPTERPYSLTGLCLYLDASEEYWRNMRKSATEEYLGVVTRVEKIIETQQFEGAAVGAFNANIIARRLGLPDAINVKQESIIRGMTKEQVAEVLSDVE